MNETQYISDFLAPRDAWDKLSIEEQAAMMKTAVSEGILDLGTIRQKYNEFAEGGNTDDDLVDWIIREEGFIANPRDIGDGKMTLGSGLTAQKWHDQYKRNGNKWTSSDNRRAVREEVANRRRWAEKNIPNWDSLPSSSQKALLSYKYNYDFNQANSPKLFKALSDSNLQEAARQMDATSSNPVFKKGLQDRRQREQEWFLRDVASSQVPSAFYQPTVSTQVYNPYVQQVETTRMLPIDEPDPNSYIRTIEVSPQEQRRRKFQENVEAFQRFNALMNLIDLRNNPAPSYNPIYSLIGVDSDEYANGGKIRIKPENRGKFTALKERTGHSATWFKEHGTPAQKKMATFALNARKWKHGLGGNLFSGKEEGSQQMNIFRRPNGEYFYQASPDSEEVTVTPLNTMFENPALWTYIDANGRSYTPKTIPTSEKGTITEAVSHGPLIDAINNYFREARYRANDNSLALEGKYMLPAAGLLATGAGALIEAPLVSSIGAIVGGELGGGAINMTSSLLSGKDWAGLMNELTGLDTNIATYTNPGYLFGGVGGTRYVNNAEKRLAESFMRTTKGYDPLSKAKIGFNKMRVGEEGGLPRLGHITNYVLTGRRVGPKGYYNSFASFEPTPNQTLYGKLFTPEGESHAYNGFLTPKGKLVKMSEKDDLIDAFFYKKDIDSSYPFNKVATGEDFGVHTDYVAQKYANKSKDIPVYEALHYSAEPEINLSNISDWLEAENGGIFSVPYYGYTKSTPDAPGFNVAGHLYRKATAPNGHTYVQQQDIWKFNPDEYYKRWFEHINSEIGGEEPSTLKKAIIKYGLKELDRLGTPIISRTKWIPKEHTVISPKK